MVYPEEFERYYATISASIDDDDYFEVCDVCGLAWLGLAWLGLAWLGLAWLGLGGLCAPPNSKSPCAWCLPSPALPLRPTSS
jgi:hypothetical protein